MALLHGSGLSPRPPYPERESRHSAAVGHPEMGHCVEDRARELHLHPLARQGATPHASADDRLVSIDRVLDHAALAVAGPLVPLASTESTDGADVPIPLLQCVRRSWTQLSVASRWDEHAHGSSLTLRVSGFVNGLGIVGTVCRDGGHSIVDLPEQGENPSAIMRSTTGQIRGDDLASAHVHCKVQLPPGSVLRWPPQIADVNPEAGAVDEQVDWLMARDQRKPSVCRSGR